MVVAPRKKRASKSVRQANESIGQVIKAARITKGFSQGELANLLGYDSGQFVSDWERGLSAIPMKRLVEISKILELDRNHLFELLLDFSVIRLSENMRKEFQQHTSKAQRRKSK